MNECFIRTGNGRFKGGSTPFEIESKAPIKYEIGYLLSLITEDKITIMVFVSSVDNKTKTCTLMPVKRSDIDIFDNQKKLYLDEIYGNI